MNALNTHSSNAAMFSKKVLFKPAYSDIRVFGFGLVSKHKASSMNREVH